MIEIVLVLAGLYGLAVAVLFVSQDGMLFPRHATPPPAEPLPAGSERWTLAADNGDTLHGVVVPSAAGGGPVVVGFPGNAWNARDFAVFLHERLSRATIVAFHYRGYTPSEGRPSERALTADAVRIADAVRRRWPERAVVPVGVSIGSGVAAALVASRDVAGAVLVSPFDSIRALARSRYPWVPVGLLLRHPFDSAARLDEVERPIAVIAAGEDSLVPPARTDALVRHIRQLVHHRVVAGADHGGLYDDPTFAAALEEALAAVLAAGARRSSGT